MYELLLIVSFFFFFSSRRRHTRSLCDWSSDVCSSDLLDSRGAPATVSVVPNDNFFSASNFRYYALRDGLRLKVGRAWEGEPVGIEYMVLKSGNQGPSWTAERPRRIAERLAHDPHLARVFPMIGEFPLPDGSTATVRARREDTGPTVRPAVMARAVERAIRARLGEVARDVEGLQIRLTYDDAILRGRIARVELRAARATVGDLTRRNAALARVRDLQLGVDDLLVNPFSAYADGRLNPLDAGLVRLERATILAADFRSEEHTSELQSHSDIVCRLLLEKKKER